MKVALALIAVAVLTAIFAGCGGADSDTQSSFRLRADTTMKVGSVTKARFVAQANQACRHGWPIILENFAQYSSWQSPKLSKGELFAKAIRFSFLAGLDFWIFDPIQKLRAPVREKENVEEVIGKMQIAVERGQREIRAYTPVQLSAQFADYNQAALRYGLVDCLVDGARLANARA